VALNFDPRTTETPFRTGILSEAARPGKVKVASIFEIFEITAL
jgi:hypothetical protein